MSEEGTYTSKGGSGEGEGDDGEELHFDGRNC